MEKIATELIKRGYSCGKNVFISTMRDCVNKYYKGNIEVVLGLEELGVPPTLISPMPYFYVTSIDGNGVKQSNSDVGKQIYGYLCRTDAKQIVDEIEEGKTIYIYD